MKRIRPKTPPKDTTELANEFIKDVRHLMEASALVHYHVNGEVPFQQHMALKIFDRFADHIKDKYDMEKRPVPVEVAKYIADKLANKLLLGECKGLTMPTPVFLGWLVFLPGGNITKLPCTGEIPVETNRGESYKLHIDIDEKGEWSVYRYHDPESDNTLIGREHYLRVIPCDEID